MFSLVNKTPAICVFSAAGGRGRRVVRLEAYLVSVVQVRARQNAFQPVTDCNCVAKRRGGEQQEVKV